MDQNAAIATARQLLRSRNDIQLVCKAVDENTVYVWEKAKGGSALLMSSDGSVLYADSSISFDVHLEAYRKGLRTPLVEFTRP